MLERINTINILVKNYDEAVDFYTNKIGFKLYQFAPEHNWVALCVPDRKEFLITFSLADEKSMNNVGRQTITYPLFILQVDDCSLEYRRMKSLGVKMNGEPQSTEYGSYVIFEDLYGNKIFMSDSNFLKEYNEKPAQP